MVLCLNRGHNTASHDPLFLSLLPLGWFFLPIVLCLLPCLMYGICLNLGYILFGSHSIPPEWLQCLPHPTLNLFLFLKTMPFHSTSQLSGTVVCIECNFFLRLTVDGRLGWFHTLVIVSRATVNRDAKYPFVCCLSYRWMYMFTCVHVHVWAHVCVYVHIGVAWLYM